MKHLINHTVYGSLSYIPGGGTHAENLAAMGADGVELLTNYSETDAAFKGHATGVHLPYAMDWRSVWRGEREVPADMPEGDVRHLFYGRDREGIVGNLADAMRMAAAVRPAYGVLHACSTPMDEIGLWEYSDADPDVLADFADMLNAAVSGFPGGEPPFTLMLENLWWPGLRLLDGSGWRFLESKLEFDDWGVCLDTGHLLIAAGGVSTEAEAVEKIRSIVERYPTGLRDRLSVIHLHMNLSAEYLKKDMRPDGYLAMPFKDRVAEGYGIICAADAHRPFTNPGIVDVVESLEPDFVTHELLEHDPVATIGKFKTQRALFR
ncbi:MAG: TIM barrel protein [Thermoplasmatales archaeon]|nr:TIM barrel protein [Thermoplasmatales archaeon]